MVGDSLVTRAVEGKPEPAGGVWAEPPRELFEDRNLRAAAAKLAALRDTPVAEWQSCPVCGFPLIPFLPVDGTVRAALSGQCWTAYADAGWKPAVEYGDFGDGSRIAGLEPEPWFPLLPSDLHKANHPSTWAIRPPDVSSSFPDLLAGVPGLEELAFGPFDDDSESDSVEGPGEVEEPRSERSGRHLALFDKIDGIEASIEDRLVSVGIDSLTLLATARPYLVAEAGEVSLAEARSWIEQAGSLVGDDG